MLRAEPRAYGSLFVCVCVHNAYLGNRLQLSAEISDISRSRYFTRRYEYAGNASRRVQRVIKLHVKQWCFFTVYDSLAVYFSLVCPVTIRQEAKSYRLGDW